MEKIKLGDIELTMPSDSLKLTKNTKGYFWEIKVVEKEERDLVEEITKIDKEMRVRFPEAKSAS